MIKRIQLSEAEKHKLSRLKGKTNIRGWNVLCRWALCYSLRDGSIPPDVSIPSASNVEMSWTTFGGDLAEVYFELVRLWCKEAGLPTDDATTSKYCRLHIERGIAFLSATHLIDSIEDLIALGGPQE